MTTSNPTTPLPRHVDVAVPPRWRRRADPDHGVLLSARSPHLPRLRYVSWGSWPEYPKETRAELKRRFPIIPLEKYD